MTQYLVSIKPKKTEFDPLAQNVRTQLLENGQEDKTAKVHTEKLYKINGDLSSKQIQDVVTQLLVDPVVETSQILDKTSKKSSTKAAGWRCDVWPKTGVTDPVGETVEKGIQDLGLCGEVSASSATRFIFPNIKDMATIQSIAKNYLANELIHDIDIQKIN